MVVTIRSCSAFQAALTDTTSTTEIWSARVTSVGRSSARISEAEAGDEIASAATGASIAIRRREERMERQ